MTRMLPLSGALALVLSLVGCVYHPGGYDPTTGLMYGGSFRPMCYGPFDRFCSWCDDPFDTCPTNIPLVAGPCMDCRKMGVCPPPTGVVPPGPQPALALPNVPHVGTYSPYAMGGGGGCPTCQHAMAPSSQPVPDMMYSAEPGPSAGMVPAMPAPPPMMEVAPQPEPYPQPSAVPDPTVPAPQTLVTPEAQAVPGAVAPPSAPPAFQPMPPTLPAPAPPVEEAAPMPMAPQGAIYRYPAPRPLYRMAPMPTMPASPAMQTAQSLPQAPPMPQGQPVQTTGGYRWVPAR